MEVCDKSTGKVLRKVKENTLSEALGMLKRASEASSTITALSRETIAEALIATGNAILNGVATLSKSISSETGLAMKSSREDASLVAMEFMYAAHQLFASIAEKSTIPSDQFDSSIMTFSSRSPLGVILILPSEREHLSHTARIIANAVSAGNGVICIPPAHSPGPFEELKALMENTGLPKDIFQVLAAYTDSRIPKEILKSGAIGETVLVGLGAWHTSLRKEMAGMKTLAAGQTSSPVIIWDDADLDTAAEHVAASAFTGYGGSCSAARKVILRENSYEYFRNRLIELASQIIVGEAGAEETDLGPLPDESYAAEAAMQLEEAVNAGASITYGGNISGKFFPPTIVEYLPPGSPLLAGNARVPLICLEQVSSMEAAINAANSFEDRVQVSVFTSDIDLATSAAQKLEFSSVLINEAPGPYSGFWHRFYENRGTQPEKIVSLREEFSRTKIVKLKK